MFRLQYSAGFRAHPCFKAQGLKALRSAINSPLVETAKLRSIIPTSTPTNLSGNLSGNLPGNESSFRVYATVVQQQEACKSSSAGYFHTGVVLHRNIKAVRQTTLPGRSAGSNDSFESGAKKYAENTGCLSCAARAAGTITCRPHSYLFSPVRVLVGLETKRPKLTLLRSAPFLGL